VSSTYAWCCRGMLMPSLGVAVLCFLCLKKLYIATIEPTYGTRYLQIRAKTGTMLTYDKSKRRHQYTMTPRDSTAYDK
ncbi:8879_t:CDS:2, partial [Gigaspora rosea]